MCSLTGRLTQADGSQQTQGGVWGQAGGEQGLQDVVGEGERNHSLVGGVDNQQGDPQTQKAVGPHTREVDETSAYTAWTNKAQCSASLQQTVVENKRKLRVLAKCIMVMHWSIVVKDKRNEWNWVIGIVGCWDH